MNLFSLLSVTFQQADTGRKWTLRTADSLLCVKFTIQGLEFRSKNEISRKCAIICKVIYLEVTRECKRELEGEPERARDS